MSCRMRLKPPTPTLRFAHRRTSPRGGGIALALKEWKSQVPAMYAVKEIYYTLQGEGAQAGRPAVFCRFAGCNLWSGREQDRD